MKQGHTRKSIVRIAIMLALLCALPAPSRAQTPKPGAPPKPLLKIPVALQTDSGTWWRDGKRSSFKLFVEEKETPIKSFQAADSPMVILIVFDLVADLARAEEARNALSTVIKELASNYWVGLLRAQDGLSVLQEPTANHELLLEKLQTIQATGKAGLLDTLEPVAQLAEGMLQKSAVRVAVLYVTDSGIANYRADYLNPVINASDAGDLSRRFSDRAVQERMSRTAETLADFTAPLFVLHLQQRDDTMNLAYQSGLERIAAANTGTATFCRTADEIRPALNTIFDQMRALYFIGIDPPSLKRQTAKLRVEARDAQSQPLSRLNFPTQISAQAPAKKK